MSESDGVSEAIGQEVRAVVMAAAQIAEQVARRAETRARTLEREAAVAAQRLSTRRAAERDTARAEVTPTRDPRWWDTAQLDAAARAYATADTWARHDPQLAAEATRIAEQIERRFGSEARTAVVTAAHTGRDTAEGKPKRADRTATQRVGAKTQLAAVALHDARASRVGKDTAGSSWDTKPRRDTFAASLGDIPDLEAVDARIRLDRARAQPATAAVRPDVVGPRQSGHGAGVQRDNQLGR